MVYYLVEYENHIGAFKEDLLKECEQALKGMRIIGEMFTDSQPSKEEILNHLDTFYRKDKVKGWRIVS